MTNSVEYTTKYVEYTPHTHTHDNTRARTRTQAHTHTRAHTHTHHTHTHGHTALACVGVVREVVFAGAGLARRLTGRVLVQEEPRRCIGGQAGAALANAVVFGKVPLRALLAVWAPKAAPVTIGALQAGRGATLGVPTRGAYARALRISASFGTEPAGRAGTGAC